MQHFAEMGLKPMLYGYRTYIKLLTSATFDSLQKKIEKLNYDMDLLRGLLSGLFLITFFVEVLLKHCLLK